ncbi:hypothetical protein Godav_025324 [Gossypium davidsonii]|uniref:Uncharacterized protein n=1 Tax=Gossypium davidsonii TaxID=34287 RepID=A0A7J8TKU5_GOSDV|nr:hypothetical protein [Gossypium davidsonii]
MCTASTCIVLQSFFEGG